MRKLFILFVLTSGFWACAQTTSSSKETSRTSTSSNKTSSESSITRSGNSYQFDARFDEDKFDNIQRLLQNRLSPNYLSKKGRAYEWEREVGGRIYFSCKLTSNELHLNLNREVSSDDFFDLIDELGDDLRDVIQTHTSHEWSPQTPTPPRTPANPNSIDPQQELRDAERELARAKRKVERLKKSKGN